MSLLVIGATSTLGRQIVKKALIQGYEVKCLVRNSKKAAFLKAWGAILVYGDLMVPETLPQCFVGASVIIDVSTVKVKDLNNDYTVDIYCKRAVLEAAIQAKVKKFVSFSMFNSSQYLDVPSTKIKSDFDRALIKSGINYLIFTPLGFFQDLTSQYAAPILSSQPVFILEQSESVQISYIDARDAANIVLAATSLAFLKNIDFPLIGNRSWNNVSIISLCQLYAGQASPVVTVPLLLVYFIRRILGFFAFTQQFYLYLTLVENLSRSSYLSLNHENENKFLKINKKKLFSLEKYFQYYFTRKLGNLKKQINNF
nr:Ycf39 [Cyanidium caldarium]